GDTVEIATNAPIAEALSLNHSLTLRSAAGFNGTLAATYDVFALASGSANFAYTISGLTLLGGNIRVHPGTTGTLEAQILDNVITGDTTEGVSIDQAGPGQGGPLSVLVAGNSVSMPPPFFSGSDAIYVGVLNSPADISIE